MTLSAGQISAFLDAHPDAMVVTVEETRGSTPREDGAFMLVSHAGQAGTIGGGQLEFLAIKRSRKALSETRDGDDMDVPLGPEIGQCCGGRVLVSIRRVGAKIAAALIEKAESAERLRPNVYVFGAGHVGQELARALAPLPLRTTVIDTRRDEMAGLPEAVFSRVLAMPEAAVRSAPEGTSFVIVTHDHALDFLIAREALKRLDAPYVGMIGSRTKRATFRTWYRAEGGDEADLGRLVSPIGGQGLGDKRPEVIAALAVAEILVHIGRREAELAHAPVLAGSGALT